MYEQGKTKDDFISKNRLYIKLINNVKLKNNFNISIMDIAKVKNLFSLVGQPSVNVQKL